MKLAWIIKIKNTSSSENVISDYGIVSTWSGYWGIPLSLTEFPLELLEERIKREDLL